MRLDTDKHGSMPMNNKKAIAAIEQLSDSKELIIPSGTSIFEAVSMTLLRADILRIKLAINADSLLATIRQNSNRFVPSPQRSIEPCRQISVIGPF